jgi:protein-S-isoprenylcysteine O-methyltransferase Ste14
VAAISRRRVTAGFLIGVLAVWLADPSRGSLTLGAGVATAGEMLRVWAAGHLEKGREITASGPYAITRHPLYLGSAFIAAGMAIASNRLLVVLIIAAYLTITIGAAIWTEEAHLTEKFGHQYPAYREGDLPRVARRFSLTRVIRNREYRAIGGLALVLAVLAWKAAH